MKKRKFKVVLDVLLKHIQVRDGLAILPHFSVLGKDMGSKGCVSQNKAINAMSIYNWKKRDALPVEPILDYCKAEGLDPFELIYC